uniref:Dihydrolipoamide acetyltransferase component of pyruvate dehydrogenase complex n=1 Tax=Salmo trutta TaxID=8032 RepID=A0A673WPY7_SALTR
MTLCIIAAYGLTGVGVMLFSFCPLGAGPLKVEMPALSPTMEEGNIVKWLKKKGKREKDRACLFQIETDKAMVALESNDDGVLAKILMEEGSCAVHLGTLIKTVEIPTPAAAVPIQAPPPAAAAPPPPMARSAPPPPPPPPGVAPTGLLRLSSAARHILDTHGLDPQLATPTLHMDDLNLLKKFPDSKAAPVTVTPAMAAPSSMATPALAQLPPCSRPMYPPQSIPGKPGTPGTYTEITASNVRRVIAQRLTQSKTTKPHAYATVDCDLGAIMQLHKEMIKVSINDFIIKAEADLPEVNVTWSGEGPQALDSISISIAVATEKGLITPIITNAADKGVQEISANSKVGWNPTDTWLLLHEYQGGSYSISNLGMFGISGFSAVINPPQVCILGVDTSRAVLRLTEETGALSTQQLMTVTLSTDGCLVDDELASRFLDKFCANLERPQRMSLA